MAEPTTDDLGVADPARRDDRAPAAEAPPNSPRQLPYLALAAVVALVVPVRTAIGPILDIDLYWHLLVGQEILSGIPVTQAARGWSFADVPDVWVSTQWLAEVLFAKLESWGGLDALVIYRTVTFVAALAALALVTLWRRPPRAGVWLFAIGAVTMMVFAQERSQQLTFILAPIVGWWVERLWRTGRLPRWWLVLPLVVIWSNFHGGWVILPLGLVLASLARALDEGLPDPAAARALLLALGAVAAACMSPSGIGNALAAPRFARSTADISEWHPVELWNWSMTPFLLLIAIVVVSWARGRVRPTRGEIALVLPLVLLGLTAWRNVTPAVLLLAPIVTGILARALGDPDPATTRPALARTTLVLGAVGAGLAIVVATIQSPVVDPSVPRGLLQRVHDAPVAQRVLNSYNVSGSLLWFGGPPPHVLVAIDGRADRYGGEFIADYHEALAAQPGWEAVVDRLAPTSALLRTQDALAGVLVAQRRWVEVAREGDYVLLRPPGTPGWPDS